MFQIYLGLDILMTVVMTVLLISCIYGSRHTDRQPRLLLVLISTDIIMLLTNAALHVAALAEATQALQIAYCCYNVAYSVFMTLAVFYLTEHLRQNGAMLSWRLSQVSACVSGLNAALWCASSYNGMFYDVISWRKGPLYLVGQIGGAVVLLLYLYLLLRYRKKSGDLIFFSVFFCFARP